jgi:oligopeptide transport system substrate-binding protein
MAVFIRLNLLFCALFLQACRQGENTPSQRSLIIGNGAEPSSLDLHAVTGQPELRVLGALFEGLVVRGLREDTVRPGVAQSWDITDSGKTYTFHLRPCLWSDGSPLTARDFLLSWRRLIAPATAGEYSSLLKIIRNGIAVREGNMPPDSLGVSSPDKSTFVVRLNAPVSFFLDLCAFEPFFPVPVDTISKYREKWTSPEHLLCNGPFLLKSWKRNVDITLEKNPSYWDAANVRLDKLVFKPVEDQLTAFNMFLGKELDWIFNVPPSKLEAAKRMPEYFSRPMFGTYYYIVNCTSPGFDSRELRKALSYAIDREKIAQRILKGIPRAATGLVPPLPDYPGTQMNLYDPVKAKSYLAHSGYGPGKPPPKLQILFNTSETHKDVAEVVGQMWKDVLGLDAELVNYEWKVYLENTKNLNYPAVARASWIGDYADPITFLELFTSKDGNNRTGYSNPEYDRKIAATWTIADPAARRKALLECENILMEDMPVIPVYYYTFSEMRNPGLKNADPNPIEMYSWKDVYLEK